ncbi:MAG: response regulator transcription factor [Candidatus Hydrothermarchaeales archaeon]
MSKRILLVDDEIDIRSVYTKMLEKEGYEVATAKDGKKALEKLSEFKPHLVILDIMMPGMDGWEVAKKIRKDQVLGDIPIIILSVKSEIEDKVKSIEEAKTDRHLAKPIEFSEILGTIKSLLNEL